jgi:alpha-glucosidase
MDLMMTQVRPLSAERFRAHLDALYAAGEWPVFVMNNHDIPRAYSRFADGVHDAQIAKLVATLYLLLRGTAILYYGEEIGMQNRDPERKEDVHDPVGKLGWPREKGRDGERTPMQWSNAAQAGFTTGTPWLPVSPSYTARNVAAQEGDPSSILAFYRRLLALRHQEPALLDGDYRVLHRDDRDVLAYARCAGDEAVVVVLNLSPQARRLRLDLSPTGIAGAPQTVLLSEGARAPARANGSLSLGPYGVYVAKLRRAAPGVN